MSNESNIDLTNPLDSSGAITVGRLFTHLKDPTNLLTYMVFTAWCKFMGIYTMMPSITVGG